MTQRSFSLAVARLVAALLALGLVLSFASTPEAHACGMFTPRIGVKTPPRLEHERTLILWDRSARRQHFIREVRFDGAGDQPFGFVVPTPSRPEVAEVKASPFETLNTRFGHTLLATASARSRGLEGGAPGAAFGKGTGAAPPVQVLEKKRVGDFTSFVLAASDANALGDWLKKNRFQISTEGRKWSQRYVELGFFFVALRYDGKKKKADEGDAILSRTLRISFATPLPYYPYAEPADVPSQAARELEVWLVGDELVSPLASVEGATGPELFRPMSEGARHEPSRPDIVAALGSELAGLVPTGAKVQTFGDWKQDRKGFGDVVFAPLLPQACDASCVRARRSLLPLLDPALRLAPAADEGDLVVPPPPKLSLLGAGLFGLAWLLRGLRRRRRSPKSSTALALAAAFVACGGAPPPEPVPPSPPDTALAASASPLTLAEGEVEAASGPVKMEPFVMPTEVAARQKALMRLLAGQPGERVIRTWSNPHQRGMGRAEGMLPPGITDASVLERRCISDDRVEAIVSYRLEAGRARVEGPLPRPVLGCIERVLAGAAKSQASASGWLSLGVISPEAQSVRERVVNARAGVRSPNTPKLTLLEASSKVSPGLDKGAVTTVLRQNFARFSACYEREHHPAQRGSVTLRFSIGPGGNVTAMAASAADVAGRTGLCIGDIVRNLAFPSPRGGQVVKATMSIEFSR